MSSRLNQGAPVFDSEENELVLIERHSVTHEDIRRRYSCFWAYSARVERRNRGMIEVFLRRQ
jgi:hypothetical protein